ncbi:chromosome partition protein Smc-like [Mytilus edulis]|uniref:chromosome partition protein Smc-like n=1 Tax=Mytilus edulis TaxID=6550 RepID=UPI0039F0168D
MPPPLANKINTKDNKEIKNKDGNKTVQSLLAPKKDQQIANQGNPPPKRDKRTFSDVSEESLEGLQDTVKKSDLDNLVKQKDLKDLVTTIVSKLLSTLKESITEEFNTKLRERTGKLKDEIDALNIDNENFKERLRTKYRQIEELQEKVEDCNHRSIDALKSANYNEQYSRKHNIRMVNFPEKRNENLRDVFVKMVKKDLNVEIEPSDVIAIHRIPGKEGYIKPVIAKVRNTEIKIKIMRNKKGLKNDIKFHDDITQRNLGLLARLNTNVMLNNAWFYNCSVYGKLKDSEHRIKFDLYDNIDEKIKKKLSSM